jgi:hypothetical protein
MAVDAADEALTERIAAARERLVSVANEEPDRWWTPHELKTRARNGWSSGVMGLALRELLDAGRFEQRSDLRVRLRT